MKRIFIAASVLISFLVVACGSGNGTSPGDSTHEEQEEFIEISIVDSIGVETGDIDYVFGAIQALEHGPDGLIYVLDMSKCCVNVYSPEGEFVRSIARQGSGPGEILNPLAMAVVGDGRILICSPFSGGIHSFFPSGEWEGISAEFTNNPPMGMIGADSNAYVAFKITIDVPEDEIICNFIIGRYEESEEPVALYYEDSFIFDPTDLSSLLKRTMLNTIYYADREGRVFISPLSSEEYLVEVFSAEGEKILEFSGETVEVTKSEEEIADEKLWIETYLRNLGAGGVVIEYNPEPWRNQISDIGVDGYDRIWVRRGTVLSPVFDVFDMSGEKLFSASIPFIGDEGQFFEFIIDEYGMMAYSMNPENYQKIYLLEIPE